MPHMSNMPIGVDLFSESVRPSERENVEAAQLPSVAAETSDD